MKTILENALIDEAQKQYSRDPFSESNVRNYQCSVAGCGRRAFAKMMCSAHYNRSLYGRDMALPLLNRTKSLSCMDCGGPTKGRGAWNRCATHYKIRRRVVLKTVLVKELGGRCQACEGVFPMCVYDFHHIGQKADDAHRMFEGWGDISNSE